MAMSRLPTLDETEAGLTRDAAYAIGDTDALEALDTDDTRNAHRLTEEFGL